MFKSAGCLHELCELFPVDWPSRNKSQSPFQTPTPTLLGLRETQETATAIIESRTEITVNRSNGTNDGLAHEGIGDLEAKCASLQEAQAAIVAWHQFRYGDNDVEFAEYGSNTVEAWDADTKDWNTPVTHRFL